jgi:hypothetical protein
MSRNLWTEEELELLRLFSEQGMTAREIAEEIGRPLGSVNTKRRELGCKTTKKNYKHLYVGTVGEVQDRLIEIMRNAPVITYEYFNRADSDLPAATTYRKYFGSWAKAMEAAGVTTTNPELGYSDNKYCQKPNRSTTVYLIDFGDFYKVGITQQTIKQRFSGNYPPYTVILSLEMSLAEAKELEGKWLKVVKPYQFIPSNFPTEGRGFTECFKF